MLFIIKYLYRVSDKEIPFGDKHIYTGKWRYLDSKKSNGLADIARYSNAILKDTGYSYLIWRDVTPLRTKN